MRLLGNATPSSPLCDIFILPPLALAEEWMARPATCRVLLLWMCSVWAIRQDCRAPICNIHELRQKAVIVEQRVHLHRAFLCGVVCPFVERHGQRDGWRVQQLDWHPETEFGALPYRLLSEVRFGVTDDFSYIFFRQFVGCLSEKCYICHKEVKEVVLFAKVAYSTLALLPFFRFFEKRLGQYWLFLPKKLAFLKKCWYICVI